MNYKYIIIVTIVNGSEYTIKCEIRANDIHVARMKIKNEIMKIGRNGYYKFDDNSLELNPTYFPPSAILSVKSIEN